MSIFESSIEFDNAEFRRSLNEHWGELKEDLKQEFSDQVEEVTRGAKALAPKDEGNLEDSITNKGVDDLGNSFEAEIGVGSQAKKYALRMHEDTYNPGEITRAKPNYKGYSPGRKYLENSLKANEQNFYDNIVDIVNRIR